jgi:hypothetical protein
MVDSKRNDNSCDAFEAINKLIIPEPIKSKLKTMSYKFLQSIQSSRSENICWNSFPNCEKSYILICDSQCLLDFITYQESNYLMENEFEMNHWTTYILNHLLVLKTWQLRWSWLPAIVICTTPSNSVRWKYKWKYTSIE